MENAPGLNMPFVDADDVNVWAQKKLSKQRKPNSIHAGHQIPISSSNMRQHTAEEARYRERGAAGTNMRNRRMSFCAVNYVMEAFGCGSCVMLCDSLQKLESGMFQPTRPSVCWRMLRLPCQSPCLSPQE